MSSGSPQAPPAAKDPRAFARVAVLGVLWSLILVGLAGVGGHDVLVYIGPTTGPAWIEQGLGWTDGVGPQYWWVIVAVVAALLGLLVAYVAVRPRRYLGTRVRADTGVFLLDRGLGRLAAATAEDCDGVDSAHATARASTLSVRIRGLSVGRDRALEERVAAALEERLRPLQAVPRIKVRDTGKG